MRDNHAMEATAVTPGWEHFEHEADMGVRGWGPTKEQAFEQAACALTAVVTDLATVEPKQSVTFECQAPDDELLFVDWLNGLIYEMATRKLLFSRFQVSITGDRLRATAWGETADTARHQPAVEVKGATYTALRVAQERPDRWIAQCIVDV